MRWKSYEEVARQVIEKMEQDQGVIINDSGARCRVKGKSGIKYQVDILTSYTNAPEFLRVIECKYHNRKIGIDPVIKLAYIMTDCDIEEGTIISSRGFTTSALTLASLHHIKLITLGELLSKSSNGLYRKFFSHFEVRQAKAANFNHFIDPKDMKAYQNIKPLIHSQNCYYEYPDGTIAETAELIQKRLNETVKHKFTASFSQETINFPAGTMLRARSCDFAIPVRSLNLKLYVCNYTMLDNDWIEDKNILLLKDTVAKKELRIAYNYEVNKNKAPVLQMSPNEIAVLHFKPRYREYYDEQVN